VNFLALTTAVRCRPGAAVLGGILLARLVLGEALPGRRWAGAFAIISGLIVIGGEAVSVIGARGIIGDLSSAPQPIWACFGLLIALWRVNSLHAVGIVSVLALIAYLPPHWLVFGFDRMIAAGLQENLLQIVARERSGRGCGLPLHSNGECARCKPSCRLSCPGAGVYVPNGFPCARRGAEYCAAHGACCRRFGLSLCDEAVS